MIHHTNKGYMETLKRLKPMTHWAYPGYHIDGALMGTFLQLSTLSHHVLGCLTLLGDCLPCSLWYTYPHTTHQHTCRTAMYGVECNQNRLDQSVCPGTLWGSNNAQGSFKRNPTLPKWIPFQPALLGLHNTWLIFRITQTESPTCRHILTLWACIPQHY